jgi:hypothetical protein
VRNWLPLVDVRQLGGLCIVHRLQLISTSSSTFYTVYNVVNVK